ncbi:tetratricopeptide repeat protein [candidate division KSB1 bacterium]
MTAEQKKSEAKTKKPDEQKSNIILARDFKKAGDKEQALKFASKEAEHLIKKGIFKDALDICVEFTLPQKFVQSAAGGLVGVYNENKKYLDALKLVEKYKLKKELAAEAATQIAKLRIQDGNLKEVVRIIGTYGVKKEDYVADVIALIKKMIWAQNIDEGVRIKSEFKLSNEDISEMVFQGFDHLMKTKNKESALSLVSKFGFKKEAFAEAAGRIFEQYIVQAEYEDAADLGIEFNLGEEKIQNATLLAFSLKLKLHRYQPAQEIRKKYKIPEEIVSDKINNIFITEVNNAHMDKALELKKAFKLPNEGNIDKALEEIRAIITLDIDSLETYTARVKETYLLLQQASDITDMNYDGKLITARSAFLDLYQMSIPDSAKARFKFDAISCLYKLDRRREANDEREEFEKEFRDLPKNQMDKYISNLRVEEGQVHSRSGIRTLSSPTPTDAEENFKDADDIFQDVIKKYPGSESQQLAEFYPAINKLYQMNFEEGLPVLMNFHTKYPESPYIYHVKKQLGTILINNENYKDAYLAFSIALETPEGKNDQELYLFYKVSCEYGGFPLMHIGAIKDLLKRFPEIEGRLEYEKEMASAYRIVGEYDISLSHYKALLPKAGSINQIEIQMEIAEILGLQKKFSLAVAEYLKLLEFGDFSQVDPRYAPTIQYNIALCFRKMGDYEKAIIYLDKILNAFDPSELFHEQAQEEKSLVLQLMKKRN